MRGGGGKAGGRKNGNEACSDFSNAAKGKYPKASTLSRNPQNGDDKVIQNPAHLSHPPSRYPKPHRGERGEKRSRISAGTDVASPNINRLRHPRVRTADGICAARVASSAVVGVGVVAESAWESKSHSQNGGFVTLAWTWTRL